MSRHEGVSCDSCLKGNFRGKRYKCLICYDYDLCSTCYEAGAATTRHNADHPMQCILTRADFELYYGGEAVSIEHSQSFTCPFCGRMGFTEVTLTEHVSAEHSDSSMEVVSSPSVCPICASQPGGDPNHVTDDLSAHLTVEHRNRDLNHQDEPTTSRNVRRIPHSGRGVSTNRPRRSQMQFTSATGFSTISPNSRDSMDPIAELLSQLSNVRRSNLAQSSTTSQLQQLQMQLHMERQQAQATRQQMERIPRRQTTTTSISGSSSAGNASLQSNYTVSLEPSSSLSSVNSGPQFLLSRCTEPVLSESELQTLDIERADRSLFVQELLLSSLGQDFESLDWDQVFSKLGLSSDSETSFLGSITAPPSNSTKTTAETRDRDPVSAIADLATEPSTGLLFSTGGRQSSDDQAILTANNHPSQRIQPGRLSNAARATSVNNNNTFCNNSRANAPLRNPPREGLQGGGRQIGRTGSRDSASPSRRKTHRVLEDKNKTTEPPPPH